MKKYMNRAVGKQHLSIITENSNSYHEESFKDLDNSKNDRVDTSHVREIVDPRKDELFKRTNERFSIEMDAKCSESKLIRNGNSYLDERDSQAPRLGKEFSFEKLDVNVKRTTTEDSIRSYNKSELLSRAIQDKKGSIINNYVNLPITSTSK
jgi:hypothetical protein